MLPAPALSFLFLMFCGALCSSMVVPYMGFFIVEGLGHPPWVISVYALLAASLTITLNRQFARRIDGGQRVHPLIGLAAAGYFVAATAVTISPGLVTVFSFGVLGFGISSSAMPTMFSLGGRLAERHGIARARFNAHMRATSSTAWMVGPAAAFLASNAFGMTTVFQMGIGAATLWLVLWWWTLPRDVTAAPQVQAGAQLAGAHRALALAAAYVFCLSLAHALTFSSLPLFYVREVGLAGYAPGLAFSIKTFVEVFAIFSVPALIARFGMFRALFATTLLAVVTIQFLASVESFPQMLFGAALEGLYYGLYAGLGISYIQSFTPERPAAATATYWNTLMVSGILAGPAAGLIAQFYSFQVVIQVASGVALLAAVVLVLGTLSTARRARLG